MLPSVVKSGNENLTAAKKFVKGKQAAKAKKQK
jgi:hypothetical protein